MSTKKQYSESITLTTDYDEFSNKPTPVCKVYKKRKFISVVS